MMAGFRKVCFLSRCSLLATSLGRAAGVAAATPRQTDGLGYGVQTQSSALQGSSSQDRDYVPLKTLLADDSSAMDDAHHEQHPV